jgi:hypothetical protein
MTIQKFREVCIHKHYLEWTCTSFEQSLAVFYAILLEERFQVAVEMLEVETCSLLSPKLTRVVQKCSNDCAGQR